MADVRHLEFVLRMLWTTREEYFAVLSVLQNLVGIGDVVLKTCEFLCYAIYRSNDCILHRFHIYSVLYVTAGELTLASPLFSKRQLQLQATYFFDSCVNIS